MNYLRESKLLPIVLKHYYYIFQKRVLEYIENPTYMNDNRCRRNLVHLQLPNSNYHLELKRKSWFHVYHLALRKAIYAHDWDQLAVLLKKSPIWEHSKRGRRYDDLSLYLRVCIFKHWALILFYIDLNFSYNILFIFIILSCNYFGKSWEKFEV